MSIPSFIENFAQRLLQPLPGVNAHIKLAPYSRIDAIKSGEIDNDAVESAVLILLYIVDNRLTTVVFRRNEYDGPHSGQISLPGGKYEPNDKDFRQTALRETYEEIGIDPSDIQIIGQLSRFYVIPSHYIIYPYVGFLNGQPTFNPDSTEVSQIIEIDVFKHLNRATITSKDFTLNSSFSFKAPGFDVNGNFIWGATAMIFSEFIQILDEISRDNPDFLS